MCLCKFSERKREGKKRRTMRCSSRFLRRGKGKSRHGTTNLVVKGKKKGLDHFSLLTEGKGDESV